MVDTVWPTEPKIFTLWPCVDFCPKAHKTAFYSSLDSVKHGTVSPFGGLAGRDIASWLLPSQFICHHSCDRKSPGCVSNSMEVQMLAVRAYERSLTPYNQVCRGLVYSPRVGGQTGVGTSIRDVGWANEQAARLQKREARQLDRAAG